MWSPSDEALLAGMAAGDERAAATFVRRHQARVYGLARAMLSDPASAEEVSQEAFTRAWRHAGAYDARRARAETWLLSITRNLAVDRLRMRRVYPVDPAKLDGLEVLLLARDSEEVSDDLRAITRGLESLPAEQRRAVVMASLFGYTASEISEIEGAPVGTVKSRIRSALMRLRDEREVADER